MAKLVHFSDEVIQALDKIGARKQRSCGRAIIWLIETKEGKTPKMSQNGQI